MSTEQWNEEALSALLRFARKNTGQWDAEELWPEDDSLDMPDETDAALIASVPELVRENAALKAEIAMLREQIKV